MDKALGGTLRLFVQKVYEGSYFTRNDETVLSVTASLPNGTTLEQMNQLMGRMEAYLSTGGHTYLFHQSGRAKRIPLYAEKQDYQQGAGTGRR